MGAGWPNTGSGRGEAWRDALAPAATTASSAPTATSSTEAPTTTASKEELRGNFGHQRSRPRRLSNGIRLALVMASRRQALGAPFAAIRNSWSEHGAHDAEAGVVAGAFEVRRLSVGQLGKDWLSSWGNCWNGRATASLIPKGFQFVREPMLLSRTSRCPRRVNPFSESTCSQPRRVPIAVVSS